MPPSTLVTVRRDVSWPVKNGGFAFFNEGGAITMRERAGRFSVSMSVAVLKDPLDERLRISSLGV